METLGQYLKRERTLRQINLEEISAATKIHLRVLKKLEDDDYASLPAPTFVKGFLKSYAKYLGLDPEDVAYRYETLIRPQKNEKKEIKVSESKKSLSSYFEYIPRTWYYPAGALALVVLCLWLYENFKQQDFIPADSQKSILINLDSDEKWFPLDGNRYYLKALIPTWVKIKVDDYPQKNFSMAKDTYKTFFAKNQILIFTSDPTSVSLSEDKDIIKPLSQENKPDRFVINIIKK